MIIELPPTLRYMGTFSQYSKPWLRSIIAQRKLLIRINRSHIDQVKAKMAIDRLERLLNTYPYDNDVYLARFIISHISDIETILPGGGSSSQRSRQHEWSRLKISALLIEDEKVNLISGASRRIPKTLTHENSY